MSENNLLMSFFEPAVNLPASGTNRFTDRYYSSYLRSLQQGVVISVLSTNEELAVQGGHTTH